MTEQMAYTIIGVILYFAAYELVGMVCTGLWEMWAWRKVGQFWEYTLNEGLRAYYPGFWYFIRCHNVLYSVLYAGLWPVTIPSQIIRNTKAIRRMMFRGYHF